MNDARPGDATVAVISERLFALAARDGGRELIVDPVFGRVSYGQAAEQVERLAHGLRAHGIGAGDIVILQLPNWAPFVIFHIALGAIGAVTATIPIVYRERELAAVIGLTGAAALVVPAAFHGFDFAAMALALKEAHPGLRQIVTVTVADDDGATGRHAGLWGADGPRLGGRRRPTLARCAAPGRRRRHRPRLHLGHHRRPQGARSSIRGSSMPPTGA